MDFRKEETFETMLFKAVSETMKESYKTETEKIREQLHKFAGRFGITPYGVGHCLEIHMNGKCLFDIPGLGKRNIKLDEVMW